MRGAFFIVGPTAAGKSEIAAEVASSCGGEIVNADAFQIYAGLDLLTAKPDPATLRKVPHHLIGSALPRELMNAAQFRQAALAEIEAIRLRRKRAFIVGGSGMYVQALTHGLSALPGADAELRRQLNDRDAAELYAQLSEIDPQTAREIDPHNKHRLVRAVEICLVSGRPVSEQRQRSKDRPDAAGVFVFRDRAELYQRIDSRVETMFDSGVIDEVRALGDIGATAAKTLGLSQIRELIAGRISEQECIASIQQATRRYAKRQLTWFQRQTSFEPLNLSLQSSSDAVEYISRKARQSFALQDD